MFFPRFIFMLSRRNLIFFSTELASLFVSVFTPVDWPKRGERKSRSYSSIYNDRLYIDNSF